MKSNPGVSRRRAAPARLVPELPEVEYTRRLLRPAMEGARFVRVLARRPDLRYPFPRDFVERLEGQSVRVLTRRAKYLLAHLSSGEGLLMHLGMSGSFRVLKNGTRAGKKRGVYYHERSELERHDHVIFEMSSGRTVVFNDPRRFGFMKILTASGNGEDWASGVIGPEPLDRGFTAESLAAMLHRRKTSLKVALLDQRVVAGLGNIYACEALHRAALSPKRTASTIVTRGGRPTAKAEALVAAIKDTLRDAIAHRHRPAGEDRFRVYDHESEPCPRRRCPGTITRIVQAGRSTFLCPICQR
jgi:formamidopyrimidine-DNA glycosylase